MISACYYKTVSDGPWLPGFVSDCLRGGGVSLDTSIGIKLGPRDVYSIRVDHRCSGELFDLIVESGYFVLGMPRLHKLKEGGHSG
jgi:hypothetical protein